MLPQPLRPEHQMRSGQRRSGLLLSAGLRRFAVCRLPSRMRLRLRLRFIADVPTVQVHFRMRPGYMRFDCHMRRP